MKGDVYEDQEGCDVLLEMDVLELLVALPTSKMSEMMTMSLM